jgi:hypothetical protein
VARFSQLTFSKTTTHYRYSYRYHYRYSLNLLWSINGKTNIKRSAKELKDLGTFKFLSSQKNFKKIKKNSELIFKNF